MSSFLFTHAPPTEIYTLSLHDALPISIGDQKIEMTNIFKKSIVATVASIAVLTTTLFGSLKTPIERTDFQTDRKSTRLNSSHVAISYAVFCLKKKKKSTILRT